MVSSSARALVIDRARRQPADGANEVPAAVR